MKPTCRYQTRLPHWESEITQLIGKSTGGNDTGFMGYFIMLAFESINCAIRKSYGFFSAVSANYVKRVNRAQAILCLTYLKKVFTLYSQIKKKQLGKWFHLISAIAFNSNFNSLVIWQMIPKCQLSWLCYQDGDRVNRLPFQDFFLIQDFHHL